MTPKEFLKTIWICEPPKGSITVENVEEAMLLYGRHLTAKKYENCPSCKSTDIYHNGGFWTCRNCTYDWNAI